ncbi:MAG: 3-dehydroquinate synthase [Candidatus Margulisiibacteriota bacterium]
MSKVRVNLKERSYDVLIGEGLLARLPRLVKGRRVVVITDYTVGALYGKKLSKKLGACLLQLPPGEITKSIAGTSVIYDKLIDLGINRDGLIIALGGGVIGDLAGFTAGTYLRGIDVIQVPTTLLAMVDAAIGGKTAINHPKGKNLIGVFHQPKLVVADVETLNTLPARELKGGLAEVIKYGFIKDPGILKMLSGNPCVDANFWTKLITRCAAIKAEVVCRDERETTGYRMILNFGHTIGHAIEAVGGFKKFSHGEAVGLGMLAAAKISGKREVEAKLVLLLKALKLPTTVKLKVKDLLLALKLDKKVKSGKVRFVLPTAVGKVTIKDNVPEAKVVSVLKELGCS